MQSPPEPALRVTLMLASEDHALRNPAYSDPPLPNIPLVPLAGVLCPLNRSPAPLELALGAGLQSVEEAARLEGQRSWESRDSGLSLRKIAPAISGWWQHETNTARRSADRQVAGWLRSLLSGGVLMWGDLFPHRGGDG